MRTAACLDCLARTRERLDVPLVPMTYSALLEAYGWTRFADDAALSGATSLIVADLPADLRPDVRRVHLVAPTSSDERIALAADRTDGGSTSSRSREQRARATSCRRSSRRSSRARATERRSALRRVRHLHSGACSRRSRARRRDRRRLGGAHSCGGRLRRARALRRLAPRGDQLSFLSSQSRPICHASVEASMCSK